MELEGKRVVVTGASRGIGRAIALRFAREGAHVGISARSGAELEKVADEIRSCGGNTFQFVGDMSSEPDIRKFVRDSVQSFGGLDILVNNAGVGHFANVADLKTETWDEMFNLNVRGLFVATRESLPFLRKAGESAVINIASIAGKNAFLGGAGYTATKHAVLAFSRCLMLEERANGVRVLAICPGSVLTSFFDSHEVSDARAKSMLAPEDVADTVVHAVRLPQRAMVSEIDIRPSDPQS
jgi:3-oxoacyl-[acyl-carrier protein] reductase